MIKKYTVSNPVIRPFTLELWIADNGEGMLRIGAIKDNPAVELRWEAGRIYEQIPDNILEPDDDDDWTI